MTIKLAQSSLNICQKLNCFKKTAYQFIFVDKLRLQSLYVAKFENNNSFQDTLVAYTIVSKLIYNFNSLVFDIHRNVPCVYTL